MCYVGIKEEFMSLICVANLKILTAKNLTDACQKTAVGSLRFDHVICLLPAKDLTPVSLGPAYWELSSQWHHAPNLYSDLYHGLCHDIRVGCNILLIADPEDTNTFVKKSISQSFNVHEDIIEGFIKSFRD